MRSTDNTRRSPARRGAGRPPRSSYDGSVPVPRADDVTVVGGGVVGLSIAWRAATTGRSVAVVDAEPGRGSSWAAAGMLAPAGEAHFGEDPLARLNVAAAARWPAFACDLEEASDSSIGYRADGTLLVAVDHADRQAVDDLLRYQLELGLDASRLTASECRHLEPLLTPGVSGGAEFRHDHQVDNRAVVRALLDACRAVGVVFVSDRVRGIVTTRGRIERVDLEGGGFRATAAVVLAAGAWSGTIAGVPSPSVPPVRPVRGLTLRLRAEGTAGTLARTVRGAVHGRHCYLVPRNDGSLVVGATSEEKGFDLSVPVGATAVLLADARELFPALDEYALVELATGLRPGSPDNAPIVGRASPEGLVVATGHYRNGFLLAPVTADAVVALLDGAPDVEAFRPFTPERFGPDRAGPTPAEAGAR